LPERKEADRMVRTGAVALVAAGAAAALTVAFVGPVPGQHGRPQLRHGLVSSAALPNGFIETEAEPAAQQPVAAFLKWLSAGLLAGLVLSMQAAPADAIANGFAYVAPDASYYSVKKSPLLNKCKDNKKFKKSQKNEVLKYERLQKKYKNNPFTVQRLDKMIADAKRRNEAYGDLLCGKRDGNPRTIANGEINVRRSVVLPGFAFLYIAGWIGWTGREYLLRTRSKEKELYIDLPLFAQCSASGFAWPVRSWIDIVNGKFTVPDEDLHYSGRAAIKQWN